MVTDLKLTDKKVSSLKPTTKSQFIADGNGLYVRVEPTGTKTFLARSRAGGVAKWNTLGQYPALSLADARKKAADVLSGRVDAAKSVAVAYEEWLDHIDRTRKSPAQVHFRMNKHFITSVTGKLSDVTRADLSRMLSAVAATAPVQANRLLGDCKAFFGFCVERGWLNESPAALITTRTVGGSEKPRDRVLDEDELRELMLELATLRFAELTRYAITICLLTGQRSGEVRSIEAKDFKRGVWKIPASKTKNGKAHEVRPGPVARRLLRSLFAAHGKKPFGEMPNQVLSRATNRMKFEPTFTPHDLRRTMATKMAEAGVEPHIVERCLNHTLGGVAGTYNWAKYDSQCAAAWRLWERILLKARKKEPPPQRG